MSAFMADDYLGYIPTCLGGLSYGEERGSNVYLYSQKQLNITYYYYCHLHNFCFPIIYLIKYIY